MKNEKEIIALINQMCEESLSPELFEKWEEVKSQLEVNRRNLALSIDEKEVKQ